MKLIKLINQIFEIKLILDKILASGKDYLSEVEIGKMRASIQSIGK